MTTMRLAMAYALDLLAGDPEWFPHPVRLFGRLTVWGERFLRRFCGSPVRDLSCGALLTAGVVAAGWSLGKTPGAAARVLLAWTVLATRSLLDEARAVVEALEDGDLVLARRRLSRIVGRDTASLDESEIARATIETLAESACDGIAAPLFWLAAGGLPAAMAYKAANTLDSMIGHPEPPYRYFGRAAARLDDIANLAPSRLTALSIAAAARIHGMDAGRTLAVWRRDGNRHRSPNSGQSEAAMAGALNVTLGGVNFYDGVRHDTPQMNSGGLHPSAGDARRAIALVATASALAFGARGMEAQAMSVHGGDVREVACELGIPESELLDFSANVNPRGLPPAALRCLAQAADPVSLRRYPDRSARNLRAALSGRLDVPPEAIVVGAGAEALLSPALRALGASRVLAPVPAFSEYRRVCSRERIGFVPFALDNDAGFRPCVDRLRDSIRARHCDTALLNNPHNPSGALMEADEVRRIAAECPLLLDEAFIDYAPGHTLVRDAVRNPGLVVIRSLTKFYGCPALRVGYAVAHPDTASKIASWLPAWPVTQPALDALAEALRDREYAEATLRENENERSLVRAALQSLGLNVVASAANFLLAELQPGVPGAAALRLQLARTHRILIRNCDSYEGLEPGRWFRVAVRSNAENRKLIQALTHELKRK